MVTVKKSAFLIETKLKLVQKKKKNASGDGSVDTPSVIEPQEVLLRKRKEKWVKLRGGNRVPLEGNLNFKGKRKRKKKKVKVSPQVLFVTF